MTSRIETIPLFYSSLLRNERDIFVYLPPSYDVNPSAVYPVLYMHDGQHLFAEDCFGDSWNVNQTIDRLIEEGRLNEIIVVAVSSLPHWQRLSEYCHDVPTARGAFPSEWNGALFERFLIEEVKTYVDSAYRTLPERQHTGLMGSSAGGLLSYHIAFRRPDVFGQIGMMSPFFFHTVWEGAYLKEIPIYESFSDKPSIRVWLDMGGAEGLLTVAQARYVADEMIELGFIVGDDLAFYFDPEAAHTQQAWSDRLHAPLLYMFGTTGTPATVRLYGRTKIGLQGLKVCLYANVYYDSGFCMSLLEAEYEVANPEIATVAPDGRVVAHRLGMTDVTVRYAGLHSTITIEVVPEVSETVKLDLSVEVPLGAAKEDRVYVGFEIPKVEEGLYRGSYVVPRGLKFDIPIMNQLGFIEKQPVNRKFSIEDEATLHFKVEQGEEL